METNLQQGVRISDREWFEEVAAVPASFEALGSDTQARGRLLVQEVEGEVAQYG